MIIIDNALRQRHEEGNPVRVALIGAGYMGRGIALQIEKYVEGMRLVAISNRTAEKARNAFAEAGIEAVRVDSVDQLEETVNEGKYAFTDNALLPCQALSVDAVIEATGDVEFSAHVVMEALRNEKHTILMNAELDATVGPLLKIYADKAGVVLTNADGDQPGVIMNLLRFVRTIGYRPVLAGNIKGLQDHYRTPETQKGFAAQHGLTPQMATAFADGTKISMEMVVVANATGFRVGRRGMYGPTCKHVNEAITLFPHEEMLNGGLVDYVLGAEPGPGVFVIGHNDHPERMKYMDYFKMGKGPFHVFYVPYHLPHLEVPLTAARAVLFRDAAAAPLGGPVVDVITVAKRDLKAGETLDGIGGFTCYGTTENYEVSRVENLLPMGLSEGCRLRRDISKDQAVGYADVDRPGGRLSDKLREEQSKHFNLSEY
jgi:predicted homoserine dehydrogenase-like protein